MTAAAGRCAREERPPDELIAACPLYVKGHSEGEFVFDWGWADAAERAGIRTTRSCWWAFPSPPSPARASWARRPPKAARGSWIELAPGRRAARRSATSNEALSGVHVNFCLRKRELAAGRGIGLPAPRGPSVPLEQRTTTKSFDDYLAAAFAASGATRSGASGAGTGAPRAFDRAAARRRRSPTISSSRCTAATSEPSRPSLLRPPVPEPRSSSCCASASASGSASRWRAAGRDRRRARTNVVKGDALYGRYWGATAPRLRHLHFERLLLRGHRVLHRNAGCGASSPARAATTSSCAASTRDPTLQPPLPGSDRAARPGGRVASSRSGAQRMPPARCWTTSNDQQRPQAPPET